MLDCPVNMTSVREQESAPGGLESHAVERATTTAEGAPEASAKAAVASGASKPALDPKALRRKKLLRRLAVAVGLLVLAEALWQGWIPGTKGIHSYASWEMRKVRIWRFVQEGKSAAPGSVVFLGSSTFYRFPFDKLYPGKPCLNRGLGSETIAELLSRIDESLPVARPSGVVIYAGVNDVRADGVPLPLALVAFDALVRATRIHFPDVPIAIVETLSIVDEEERTFVLVKRLNDGLQKIAKAHGATYVPTLRPELVDERGRLKKELSSDKIHVNEQGFAYLAKWIAEDGGDATAVLRAP